MFKKATKSIAWLAVLVLALSIFAGYFASVQFSAKAAGGVAPIDMFSGQAVVSKVKYNDTFAVPVDTDITVSVKKPNGKIETVTTGSVLANQLGTYEVTVTSRTTVKVFYKYNVQCYLDGDYILVIDKGGAILPSYWKSTNSAKVKLPNANVYIYDEDAEEYVKDSSQDINVRVTSPAGVETLYFVDKGNDTVKVGNGAATPIGDKDYIAELALDKIGKWFVTYYTYVEGETNVLSEEFVTQVQTQFDDESAPTLSVSGVPATASINTKVTIPTAIVSDNYDRKVIVDISVKHKYGNNTVDVPMTIVDKKTGYVTSASEKFKDEDETGATANVADAATAVFDNNRFMYFYPTEAGSYTVTYQAQDTSCFYKINTKNASVKYVYTIVVSDTTAPVFDSIDDYKIPTKWGNDVYMYDENETGNEIQISDKNIHFPIPEVYDNNDKPEDITISFNFTDNGGRTVASFTNINSTEASNDNKYAPSSNLSLVNTTDNLPYYFFRWQDNYNIDNNGKLTPKAGGDAIGYDFATVFNFDLWNPGTSSTKATKHGDYSVVYRAYDNAGARNFQAKSYSINYSSEYKDLIAPDVRFNVPNYIAFTAIEEEIKITDVKVADSGASRINSEYYVVFNANSGLTKDNFNTLISGNDLIRLDSSLGTNTLKVQKLGGKCRVTAKNNDGIDQTVADIDAAKPIYVAVRATDSVGNEKVLVKEITAIDASVETAISAGKVCSITQNGYFGRPAGGPNLNTEDAVRGEEYCLGNFKISFAANTDRKQTGFEIYAQRIATIEANGDYTYLVNEEAPLSTLAFETYSVNDDSKNDRTIYIDNVRFTPSSSGLYMVVLRGYHISGLSDVRAYYVEAGGTDDDNGLIGANTIPLKGDVNVTYTLTSEIEGKLGSYVVRSITGSRMSLMYDQFTAKSGANYGLMDYSVVPSATKGEYGYISYDAATHRPIDAGASKPNASKTNYTFEASDNEAPTIKLLDIMPTYSPKNQTVVLPQVSATSANGIVAKLVCDVTYDNKTNSGGNGNTVSKTQGVGNSYSFVAENDGVYRVTYKATINGNETSVYYDINVGDVEPPTFNVIDYGFATSNDAHIIGYINDIAIRSSQSSNFTATIGDTFKFGYISVLDESRTGYTYSKQLKDPSGESADVTSSASSYGNSVTFTTAGYYTVIYTVWDENNNETYVEYKITVTSSTVNVSTEAITTLSIVLIVIGIFLVAGVVIYLVRFRKHKRA